MENEETLWIPWNWKEERQLTFNETQGIIKEIIEERGSADPEECHRRLMEAKERLQTSLSLTSVLIKVKGGTFLTEYNVTHSRDESVHTVVHMVTLTYDYWIGKYPVTFNEYDTYCAATGQVQPDDEGWGRWTWPVINVSWYDAIGYCNWLSEREGLAKAYDSDGNLLDRKGRVTTNITKVEGYRLPTEAEWVYAARGGQYSRGHLYAGSNDLNEVGWYNRNSGDKTQSVGQKKPNELGLYDMSGNVAEWCHDRWAYYTDKVTTNPTGPDEADSDYDDECERGRVHWGGSWCDAVKDCRVAYRFHSCADEEAGYGYIGFRLVRTVFLETYNTSHKPTWGRMVLARGGSFRMGEARNDSKGQYGAKPVHTVNLTYDFWIGKYAVTFSEYDAYCEARGKRKPHDLGWGRWTRPVIDVSWYDAIGYCNWLSEREGLAQAYDSDGNLLDRNRRVTTDITQVEGYRLPTEAEWEYAARGGQNSRGYIYAGSDDLNEVGWYGQNAGDKFLRSKDIYLGSKKLLKNNNKTHPVGEKKPNELGLYDMSGNVWEWCHDRYGAYSSAAQINPTGPSRGACRVKRSCDWNSDAMRCRVTFRFNHVTHDYSGFRLARTVFYLLSF